MHHGISMNLVTYLVGDLHITSSKSANIVTNFMGSLHLLAIVGGFLADAKLGRFVCVAFFATLAAVGVGLLTLATSLPSMRPPVCDNRHHHKDCVIASGKQMILLYVSLYITALGAGSIKANVSGFGTDQFDNNDPKEEKAMIFFFNRFYFCISIGSLFAVTLLVYIQDNISRGVGYGISAVAMAIAVAILLLGTKRYRYKKPQGSPLTVIGTVLYMAWKKRRLPYPSNPFQLNQYCGSKVPHTKRFRCLDKAAIIDWDVTQEIPDYSMDFTKIREMKMKSKQDFSRISVGNEAELVLNPTSDPPKNPSSSPHPPAASVHNHTDHGDDDDDQLHQRTPSCPVARKGIWNYLHCCMKA